RLQQVIRNLLSNAFKFTERGGVALTVAPASGGWSGDNESLNHARSVVALSVRDTGIGIAPDKQQIIFEAFQQADGSTSRKYGGTGLGLAISREIARVLGGEIRVSSEPGIGSTFTLYLPQSYSPPKAPRKPASLLPEAVSVPAVAEAAIAEDAEDLAESSEAIDDRDRIESGDRVLLIVDNDESFGRFVLDVCRENGFKGLLATSGAAAVALAHAHRPDAITLDLRLPDIDGWKVLDRLKNDLETRHIPVHIISTDEEGRRGLALGAVEAIVKPIRSRDVLDEAFAAIRRTVEPRSRKLLLAVGDEELRRRMFAEVACAGIDVTPAATVAAALAVFEAGRFDCAIVDLSLPDASGLDLAERIAGRTSEKKAPVIVYAPSSLSKADAARMKRLAAAVPIKEVQSPERLVDQTSLFLHIPVASLPETKRSVLEKLYQSGELLAGKKV
ncbi:MAG: ATP-binding protein, partial [Candidatus Binatia bacterium]